MSEKQKMLNGDLYKAWDEELVRERLEAREAIFEFNGLKPSEDKERRAILRKLFRNSPKNFYVEPPFRCDYGINIIWGENSYANFNLIVLDCALVTIGENVLIGPNVNILAATHPIDAKVRNTGLELAKPITIGDGSWIGGGVIINPGVTIGKNTVIGSGSVVTKDIPDNVVACGNPCKVIKEI